MGAARPSNTFLTVLRHHLPKTNLPRRDFSTIADSQQRLSWGHKLLWASLLSQPASYYYHYGRAKLEQETKFRLHWARVSSLTTSRALASLVHGQRRRTRREPPAGHLLPAQPANQNGFRMSIGVRKLLFVVRAAECCRHALVRYLITTLFPTANARANGD